MGVYKSVPVKRSKWPKFPEIPAVVGYCGLAFFALFLYFYVLSYVPDFYPRFFKLPLFQAEPFSELVNRFSPFGEDIAGSITSGICGVYVILTDSNFFTAIISSLLLLVDGALTSFLTLSPAMAYQTTIIILAALFEHQSYLENIMTKKWFASIILLWLSCGIALLFNADVLGCVVARFISLLLYITTYVSQKVAKTKSGKEFLKFSWSTFFKCSGICYGIAFLILGSTFFIQHNYFHYNSSFELPNFNDYIDEFNTNEQISFLLIFICSIGSLFFVKYNDHFKYTMYQLLITVVVTFFFPINCFGESSARKLFFAKIHLFLFESVIFGYLESQAYSRIGIIILLIIGFGNRVYARNHRTKPLYGIPT